MTEWTEHVEEPSNSTWCIIGALKLFISSLLVMLGFFRETEPTGYMYVCVHTSRDLLWEIGSHNYEVWAVPQSAVCKQETQENWWCNSVWDQRPESQGDWWCKSQSEDRRWDVPSQWDRKRKWISPFSLLFVLFRPSIDWVMLTHTGSIPIQMLISSGNNLIDMHRNNV